MIRLFILTLLFTVSASFTYKGADTYSDKQIDKTLKKFDKIKNAEYQKIQIPDSVNYAGGNFFMLNENEKKVKYIYKGRVNTCRAGGCSIQSSTSLTESSEYFRYIVLFNKNKEITFINIYEYNATHGYEISTKWWLKQFKNKNIKSDLKVGKNIDAISGATISTHAITDDLKKLFKTLRHI